MRTLPSGLKASGVSRDPAVVADYLSDPLNHGLITARLAPFILDAGPASVAAAAGFPVPTETDQPALQCVFRQSGSFRIDGPGRFACPARSRYTVGLGQSHVRVLENESVAESAGEYLQIRRPDLTDFHAPSGSPHTPNRSKCCPKHCKGPESMPLVRLKENEPFDVALRRFKRTIEKTGLLTELRAREFYEKPTAERKRKKAAAVKRHYKRLRSQMLPKKKY